jgi:serine/threonine-protein kinase
LIARLGAGGMGEVFLASLKREDTFEKLLVVKRILPALSSDEIFVGMFEREARVAALLNHQNIVDVYDFGRFEDEYFIAIHI